MTPGARVANRSPAGRGGAGGRGAGGGGTGGGSDGIADAKTKTKSSRGAAGKGASRGNAANRSAANKINAGKAATNRKPAGKLGQARKAGGRGLERMFRPKSVAVLGGRWAENVVGECAKSGFDGEIWPVHPKRRDMAGVPCIASLEELPGAPDAAFLGINRHTSVEVVARLAEMGCGGVVCFASGFAETGDVELQQSLVEAAGEMPVLGPNCYGFLNYLDGAMLWPDQHGGVKVERGVAIVSQSSNIAINISMQKRGLPIGYIACVGNQAQTSLTGMTRALLEDERISAAGIYIEGIADAGEFADMALAAARRGKSIVAIKSGKSESSRVAATSHTAALAGDAVASSAFLRRCGVIEVSCIEEMLETLKILHVGGRIGGRRVSAMCCSGGEAGLLADLVSARDIDMPDIPGANAKELSKRLGPLVAIANPLDYHTFIWADEEAMTGAFAAMMGKWVDISVLVIDFPHAGRCSDHAWLPAIAALRRAGKKTKTRTVMMGSIAEGIGEERALQLIEDGIVPLCGLAAGIRAIELAATPLPKSGWRPLAPLASVVGSVPVAGAGSMLAAGPGSLPAAGRSTDSGLATGAGSGSETGAGVGQASKLGSGAGVGMGTGKELGSHPGGKSGPGLESGAIDLENEGAPIDEAGSKALLSKAGITVPKGVAIVDGGQGGHGGKGGIAEAAKGLSAPLALKGLGSLHKSEAGLVKLGLSHDELAGAAGKMKQARGFLVEEMAPSPAAEIIVGLRRDPIYGATLTVGAGGVAAEVVRDAATLVLPVTVDEIGRALGALRMAPLFEGYRGAAPADMKAAVETIAGLCRLFQGDYAITQIEINPLFVFAKDGGTLAVDALIWKTDAA